mgnify:CR=1 FL=1
MLQDELDKLKSMERPKTEEEKAEDKKKEEETKKELSEIEIKDGDYQVGTKCVRFIGGYICCFDLV